MKLRVLVLDDQVRYTRALQRAIGSEFEVVTAATVGEAQGAMTSDVQLVISDIRLSEADPADRQGLDFIGWVRARFPDVPVIALSALDEEGLDQRAVGLGASCFLRKPVTVSSLRTAMAEALGSAPHS